jgi:hypothetical protein
VLYREGCGKATSIYKRGVPTLPLGAGEWSEEDVPFGAKLPLCVILSLSLVGGFHIGFRGTALFLFFLFSTHIFSGLSYNGSNGELPFHYPHLSLQKSRIIPCHLPQLPLFLLLEGMWEIQKLEYCGEFEFLENKKGL